MAVKKAKKKSAPARPRAKKAKKAKSVSEKGLSMSSASPSITTDDLQKSVGWYRDVLGFLVEERWEQDGMLTGVMVRAGDVRFMLGQDDWKKGRDRKKGEGFRLYCETKQSVDALAEKIKARGGTLDQEPHDDWGTRAFSLTDPDGFKITIAGEAKKR
jgi:lactoylglutathione lyase